ncbi:anti-sigma factor [Mesorhizobium sp. M1C.F.Ca.ET.193.01.1.1]|uniref:anti-sigma factor family protein n=1 Tax=unclassified Mesorhizobium TaxID=325217 RepID=UPI000FD2ED42|nr:MULTISPECIES: anti-sigma factor [unclassified Mesorhizobium]TGT04761.1 anti-sigma factor [bacterium M00.F.Ca.ET.177.01.1.1]TGQ57589.1 anti-sigma factor [Mesorhizobium sp. M1C.F.Ca.ET.210.01.1.1]TGQ76046.1 anti-sigma factor [Mesorhizobium sp. M1C.F.Ca.ET.212.01.1.1]TGR14430.1 anti-sigma factor [Mesorhizobium sp. M1C.F.Ca.ET.204.01.1.1]TGR35593.1 anti-sigma factor [Mesorhizobium sp. M1C.F.Ca.ET.196.01.1.1]
MSPHENRPREDGLPQDPQDMKLMIHALVDGELDAAAALAVERRIAADPELAAEHARILALRKAVAGMPRPTVSDDFLARIAAIAEAKGADEAEAGQAATTTAAPQPQQQQDKIVEMRPRASARRFASFDWRQMAASIVLTAFLASGATQWLMVQNAPDSFAIAVANGHRRSLLAATPVDIVSSDRHTVKPWLDGRIGVSPPAPDMAKDGYALLGGRVEVIGDKPMPALVYRHHEHLITLVAAPRQNDVKSMPATDDLSAGGFLLVHWTDGAFSYWAVSDAERPALDDFVARFRAAIVANPAAGSPG